MAKLHWRYGSMNSGKTLALLAVAHNYEQKGHATLLFTSGLDDRAGVGTIWSRVGISHDAEVYDKNTVFSAAFARKFASIACILVDEAQFLTSSQVVDLHKIAAIHGVPVICYGLRTDFLGKPFEGAAMLGVLADDILEIKTTCQCGRKATMNIRLDGEGRRVVAGEQVVIGGSDRYAESCPSCFYREPEETVPSAALIGPDESAALADALSELDLEDAEEVF